jgi:hypothetical protein
MPEIRLPSYWAMTLGEFIRQLEAQPQENPIVSDTGEMVGGFSSYRGYYEDLAIVPAQATNILADDRTPLTTVGAVLAEAEACIGRTFQGWKGGDYTMEAHADLWFAQEGSAIGWRPVGLRLDEGIVTIVLCGGL